MSLKSVFVLCCSHLLAISAGGAVVTLIFFKPMIQRTWSPPDVQLGSALSSSDEEPEHALEILELRTDITPRTRLMLELYVQGMAAKSADDRWATRAVELCRELRWPNCDAEFIRTTVKGL
jgi:hypothetical protein